MKELNDKLIKVIEKLKAPKNQKNNFGGYKYRSCEDILEAVKPLLNKEGLRLKISDEICEIGDRIYVKATATITDGENSESNTAFAREALTKKGMDESQITGTASSYARKYALNGLLCIDDTKDADTDEFQQTMNKAPKTSYQKPIIRDEENHFSLKSFQKTSLQNRCKKLGYDEHGVNAILNKIDSKASYDRVIKALDDKIKALEKK
jgi:gp40